MKMPIIMFREGTREADRLLEEHKGAEAEAKKLKAGMDSSVGICILEGVFRIMEGVLCILEGEHSILEGVYCILEGVFSILKSAEWAACYRFELSVRIGSFTSVKDSAKQIFD